MISLRNLGLMTGTFSRNLSNFKSALSLSNLYPNSSFTTPVKIPENEKFNGFIPIDKLQISYSKSSGPGGQHINTTNTKVDIRFHVGSAGWLSHEIRENIIQKLRNRVNKDGFLIVRSDKTRSQIYNQADAMTILRELIRSVIEKNPAGPSEETVHMLRKRGWKHWGQKKSVDEFNEQAIDLWKKLLPPPPPDRLQTFAVIISVETQKRRKFLFLRCNL